MSRCVREKRREQGFLRPATLWDQARWPDRRRELVHDLLLLAAVLVGLGLLVQAVVRCLTS